MSEKSELSWRIHRGERIGDLNVSATDRALPVAEFAEREEITPVANDLVDVLGVIKFPAWVEATDANCLFFNGRQLGSLVMGEDLRRQVSEQLAGGGSLSGLVAVRQRNAVQRILDVVVYPLFLSAYAFAPKQALRIVVVCDSDDRAERDRDVSFALWGKLLRGHSLEEDGALSPQQRRIYRLLRKKLSYKEMAAELGVAHSTIRVQVSEIRKILGCNKVPVLRRSLTKLV